MDIGEQERVIIVEPLEVPEEPLPAGPDPSHTPAPERVTEPTPEREREGKPA